MRQGSGQAAHFQERARATVRGCGGAAVPRGTDLQARRQRRQGVQGGMPLHPPTHPPMQPMPVPDLLRMVTKSRCTLTRSASLRYSSQRYSRQAQGTWRGGFDQEAGERGVCASAQLLRHGMAPSSPSASFPWVRILAVGGCVACVCGGGCGGWRLGGRGQTQTRTGQRPGRRTPTLHRGSRQGLGSGGLPTCGGRSTPSRRPGASVPLRRPRRREAAASPGSVVQRLGWLVVGWWVGRRWGWSAGRRSHGGGGVEPPACARAEGSTASQAQQRGAPTAVTQQPCHARPGLVRMCQM